MFGQKSNISLVFDFMETDLEVIIKDTSIVLTQPNIKAYMIMTLKGLEYLHSLWILHRVLCFDVYFVKLCCFKLRWHSESTQDFITYVLEVD